MEQELGVPWEDVFDPSSRSRWRPAQSPRSTERRSRRRERRREGAAARREGADRAGLALLEVFAEKVGERPGLNR